MRKRILLALALAVCCLACDKTTQTGGSATSVPPTDTTTPELTASVTEAPGAVTATLPEPGATLDGTSTVPGREVARVTRVVDGDTIDVELNGAIVRIRYIGIDTPETVDPESPVECFGREASEKNLSLVSDRVVELEKDVSETDRYGRLLRYVYVDGRMVNEEMVLGGYATAATFPPDVKYQERFSAAQVEAREADRGLWGTCVGATPTPVVSSGCPQGCAAPPPGCEIKGNINSSGVKIYHVPSGEFYEATIIDTLKGERWFCTADEAIVNGWRASQR